MKLVLEAFAQQAAQKIKTDARFCGLAVGGSWISGEIDEYSDLDLLFVAHDESYADVFADRLEVTKSLGDYVSSFTGEHVGEPRLLICLFRNPLLHVDAKFVALKDFAKRIEDPAIVWEKENLLSQSLAASAPEFLKVDPQWIEDRFWTWVHYCAVKIGRGELFEAISTLNFFRERVLGPLALASEGKSPRGLRRLERYVPVFAKKLKRTLAIHDEQNCLAALKAVVALYQEVRSGKIGINLVRSEAAELECMRYLEKFEQSLKLK